MFQVFAGLLDPSGNGHAKKILNGIEQRRRGSKDSLSIEEGQNISEIRIPGQIVPVELDSTREDSLHACLDAIRAKLPAGEDGKYKKKLGKLFLKYSMFMELTLY